MNRIFVQQTELAIQITIIKYFPLNLQSEQMQYFTKKIVDNYYPRRQAEEYPTGNN